jgi:hypothetical protein
MKHSYTLRLYKKDKRLTRGAKYGSPNKIGKRFICSFQYDKHDKTDMKREVRKLRRHYKSVDGYSFEYFPTYKTVTNLMSGKKIQIATDTPICCDPSSETYWSM